MRNGRRAAARGRWALSCLLVGFVMVTGALIVQSWRPPAVPDFGTDRARSVAAVGAIGLASAGSSTPTTLPTTPPTPTPTKDPTQTPAPAAPSSPIAPASMSAAPESGQLAAEYPSPQAGPVAPESVSAGATPGGSDSPAAPSGPVAGVPVRLELPSLKVTADIHPVGVTNGELDVPENPLDVGWWTGGVVAGSATGATVIDGHVDSAELGRGALYRLSELGDGDEVRMTVAGGGTIGYRVDGRRSYVKTDGLPPELFDSSGPPRLVLITCGGSFDRSAGSYRDNIVVFASPA